MFASKALSLPMSMLDWDPLDCDEVSEIDNGGVSTPELKDDWESLGHDEGLGLRNTNGAVQHI